ncbi:unnamed protein product, partial [Amoebophrya sp. A25]
VASSVVQNWTASRGLLVLVLVVGKAGFAPLAVALFLSRLLCPPPFVYAPNLPPCGLTCFVPLALSFRLQRPCFV